MPVFEVIVLTNPTHKESEEEGKEEVLLTEHPILVVAKDKETAIIRGITGKDFGVSAAKLKVLVRPFV